MSVKVSRKVVPEAFAAEEDAEAEAATVKREIYWCYQIYVLGAGPALVALVTVGYVNIVRYVATPCAVVDLGIYLLGSQLSAYVYLFLYAWMFVGPVPFRRSVKKLRLVFFLVGALIFAWHVLVFLILATNARPCVDSAPMMYNTLQFQCFAVFSIFVAYAVKAANEKVAEARRRSRQSAVKRMEEQVALENDSEQPEESSAENESDDDGEGEEEEDGEDEDADADREDEGSKEEEGEKKEGKESEPAVQNTSEPKAGNSLKEMQKDDANVPKKESAVVANKEINDPESTTNEEAAAKGKEAAAKKEE